MTFKPFFQTVTFLKSFVLDLTVFHAVVSPASARVSDTKSFIISLINLGFSRIRKALSQK